MLFVLTMKNQLHAISAFNDNYIWLLHNQQHAVVVDPGDATPVLNTLNELGLVLDAILITHHHHDHVGGIDKLKQHFPQAIVYGPALESIPKRDHALKQDDTITLPNLHLSFKVLDIPGHTAGHIAYFGCNQEEPLLFCGDALFSGGCGRLFEGTAAQMVESLSKITALPPSTLVCCAHEYTLSNLNWALQVEPDNLDLQSYHEKVVQLRENKQSTLPSTVGLEMQINPFLRTHVPAVQLHAAAYSQRQASDNTDVFAQLREWKNHA